MSECKLDHSTEDVIKKLEEQSSFLPQDLYAALQAYLQNEREQQTLNEIFHLLKKYDLSSAEEREQRNQKLQCFV
ncbi:hypothetical protein [Brevibacillus sp. SYSU BS000544]|uniref:hypothetical protein n=1 Tax=Brevibacillus sp. SYSU BS000544 TaxID=3416443 RepID=UPI003CE5A167